MADSDSEVTFGGVRRRVIAVNDKSAEALAALDKVLDGLEQAQAMMTTVGEGSGQFDVSEAQKLLAQAFTKATELRQAIVAAMQACDAIYARL